MRWHGPCNNLLSMFLYLTPVVSLIKKLYPHCLVLLDSRNGFGRDINIELNKWEPFERLAYIRNPQLPFVKYRQTPTKLELRISNCDLVELRTFLERYILPERTCFDLLKMDFRSKYLFTYSSILHSHQVLLK